ncbi:hypothetical protein M2M59_10300 [Rummeliibacillus sp. G93]|uniref:type IV pilus modification PilV family protein n=1 Tax=Rummeliibacillus sp. G93 TaxID=2939494 RepID=UPI00201C89CD|nr:hypothetical protein [Rummeliibacillus sp. G93]UQW96382.1 hypothetical protein M2M59_10300 [Rummeliibacillus sp. G93]
MASQNRKIIVDEKGATLIEVIASFALIVIILLSFFTLFIQTSKTTKNSERIVDATYIAQTEMEKAYNASTKGGLDVKTLTGPSLNYIAELNSATKFSKTIENYKVTLSIKSRNTPLKSIVIQVTSNLDNKQKALMEKIIVWKEN